MTANIPNDSVKEKILGAIKEGRVAMRPRWHFILKTTLFTIGVVLLLLALLYAASMVMFLLRDRGLLFVPEFGPRGWFALLRSLPWLLVFLSVIFLGLLEVLVRRYAFAYRQPLLYSVLGLVALVALGSIALDRMNLHFRIRDFSHHHSLPPMRGFYDYMGEERPDRSPVIHGKVLSINGDNLVIAGPDEKEVLVHLTPETRLPGGALATGTTVIVLGDYDGTGVRAFGVRTIMSQ